MPVETEADRAIFLNTDDFGSAVTYNGSTFNAVFDNETFEIEGPGSVPYLQERPMIECRTTDVSNIAEADVMVIAGITYHVKMWFHDGKGMTKVELEKQ